MTTVRQAWSRLLSFFRTQALERDFDEELATHIELAAQDHVRRGMNASDARRRALIELGGIEPSKQLHRESRGLPWLDGMVQDVRHAVRALRRSPSFTLTAIATLALGMGVNAAVFTLTNAVLFKGFPLVDGNDRLVYISSRGYGCCASYPDFEDWRAQAKSFTGMGVVHGFGAALSDDTGFAEECAATEISAETFGIVGQQPLIGRDFTPSDEVAGAAPVAILNHRLWERRYGKDPGIVGRSVRINGLPTTIIGVMPEGFSFPQNQDVWLALVRSADTQKRENRDLWFAFGRMVDGATVESVRAEMDAIGRQLAIAYPQTNQANPPVVQTFAQFFVGPNAATIYAAMWGAVGFVVLIACANLANLTLARAIGRAREVSLRLALGAGRWRIVRQLIIESVMLSLTSGLVGWWIAKWGVRAYALADRPWRVLDYAMDARVLGYVVVMSVGTGLLFGFAPALRLSRLDANTTLKDGGRGITGGRCGRHVSALLVIAEMALAIVLLAGAGVMIRSFLKIYHADFGVKTADVLALLLPLPEARYPAPDARAAFFERVTARLEAVPGVDSVALASGLPAGRTSRVSFELADAPAVEAQSRPTTGLVSVSPGYFGTLGATLRGGRDFTDADRDRMPAVAIVNERFASQYWPGEDPLGKRLRVFDKPVTVEWLTVVGVVSNIVQDGAARAQFDPLLYVPYRQRPTSALWVLAHTHFAPAALATAFRRELAAVDSDLPIGNLWTLTAWLEWPYREHSNFTALFLIFAAIALLLASVGLYAVIAHSVSQRTQEIGVRMAVGATAGDILGPVLIQGLSPLAIGLAIGLAASFTLNRLLTTELVQVSPMDPLAYAGATMVLVVSATIGCMIPALRAIHVDPVVALRHE